MIFDMFSYIAVPEFSGDVASDARRVLIENGKAKTFEHVRDVAEMNARIGRMFGLNEEKCRAAGYLHDISAVIRPGDMLEFAKNAGMGVCEAEERYPFLLHQRLSAVAAQQAFGVTDEDVLSAVACHTTLKADASPYDMALFLADKIAWDQPGEPPYLNAVIRALETSLEKACLVYMEYAAGSLLCPHDSWVQALEWLKHKTL